MVGEVVGRREVRSALCTPRQSMRRPGGLMEVPFVKVTVRDAGVEGEGEVGEGVVVGGEGPR